jgi:hypothetical protein
MLKPGLIIYSSPRARPGVPLLDLSAEEKRDPGSGAGVTKVVAETDNFSDVQ